MGGSTFSLSLILMLTASMLAVSMANKDWHFGFNYTNWPFKGGPPQSQNDIPGPRKIVVGGSENWQLNFNYTDWALKNGPFYLNDTLGELPFLAYYYCLSKCRLGFIINLCSFNKCPKDIN